MTIKDRMPMLVIPSKCVLQKRRIVLGFALAPLLPGFYAALLFGQPWAFPIGLALSYPTALLFGMPLLIILRRRNWLAWWQFGLCGAVCVLPLELFYWSVGVPPHLEAFGFFNAVLLEGWGILTGLIFWLLVIFGTSPVRWRELFGLGL
jgi:hypothetical protein